MSKIQTTIKGYKVFNSDWTCMSMQYKVGESYEMEESPVICERGFHFCKKLIDCFNYYSFDPNNKVAEVEAYGELDFNSAEKHCTNKIKIIRELSWQEVLDAVNIGRGCTGLGNVGNRNTGDENVGYRNSGNRNSGDWNSGNRNSGDWNSGNRNSGDRNAGFGNNGHGNTGSRNSGDYNTGNRNIGDWNRASNCTGCFNTISRPITFFDKPSSMTLEEWRNSSAYWLLAGIDLRPVLWAGSNNMTDDEKENYPDYKITGGYLKVLTKEERIERATDGWMSLTAEEKRIIKGIPNFDAKKFSMIMGIPVELIEE